jgi:TRAP-type mannitol/chloroaromatic compound transport system permease small subunit
MGTITSLARAITNTNYWIARVMSYVVLILFVLLLGDVIMRYVQERPIAWSAEASKLIFGVYAIIGGGYVLARREHVNVDLFYASFSPKRKAAVDIATSFLFFLFLGILLKESFSLAWDSVERWEISYDTTWQPWLWPSKCMIFVAALLLFLQGIVKLIADVMILMDIAVDETAFGPLREPDDEEKEAV